MAASVNKKEVKTLNARPEQQARAGQELFGLGHLIAIYLLGFEAFKLAETPEAFFITPPHRCRIRFSRRILVKIRVVEFDAASIIDAMVELTRKQREIQLRTQEILRVAKPILLQEGFHALTMDRVAASMQYAKGTIYNHFPNKEEIVLALAYNAMKLRQRLFNFASQSPGRSRERLMRIGLACEFYTQHCREEFQIEQWMRHANIWDKSSSDRQACIRECEAGCMAIVAGLVREGIQSGDLPGSNQTHKTNTASTQLTNTHHLSPEEMVFGLWAITFGSQILSASSPSLPALGVMDPIRATRVHCCTLLNGFNWQPILAVEEYLEQVEQMSAEVLPRFEEIQRTEL
jgi:AcrR family transcriptional regulator